MLGLYIHIPFCKKICSYCDFYKMVVSDKFKQQYVNYLIKEINIRNISKYQFDTIYIGGGTPSSLKLSDLELLLSNVTSKIDMSTIKEFTFEVNPEDVCEELISLLVKYQVNRISMGIETFSKKIAKILNRCYHSFDEIKEKINIIKKYGINNINGDLIYAVNTETLNLVKSDLRRLLKLGLTHISTYSLILEEKTILYEKYKKKEFDYIDEETDEKMYKEITRILKKNNFIHYETSNFALPNYEAIHNLKYWKKEEYLGIGAGSSSYINHERFTNVRNIKLYYDGLDNNNLNIIDTSKLSFDDETDEFVMLGLRMMKGLNKDKFFKLFNISLKDRYPNIDNLISEGLLVENESYIYIPEKYSYIANHIIIKII